MPEPQKTMPPKWTTHLYSECSSLVSHVPQNRFLASKIISYWFHQGWRWNYYYYELLLLNVVPMHGPSSSANMDGSMSSYPCGGHSLGNKIYSKLSSTNNIIKEYLLIFSQPEFGEEQPSQLILLFQYPPWQLSCCELYPYLPKGRYPRRTLNDISIVFR